MLDPIMMMEMGDAQLEGLRQEAAIRRALAPEVAWWQRLAGRAMPGAGARLLGDRASVRPLEPVVECESLSRAAVPGRSAGDRAHASCDDNIECAC